MAQLLCRQRSQAEQGEPCTEVSFRHPVLVRNLESQMLETTKSAVSIAPMQWALLKDIAETEPVGDADAECLQDVREVLERHGMLDRFGVMLLHSHFHVSEDEVLLEHSDHENRQLRIDVVPVARKGASIQTQFRFMPSGAAATVWCTQQCATDVQGNHYANGHKTV
jgi:hypothetical protein